MALEVKRTGSEDYGFWVKQLVCGEPGSGKTLTGSTWPEPLYINAEGGLMSIADRNLPAIDVKDTSTLVELRQELAQKPNIREKNLGVPVSTVVVDTFDEIARLFQKERMEQTGKDAMAIQDWGWLGEQLRAMVRAYRNLPLNVIFNCHLKTVTDEETGKMFLKPAIAGAMGDEIAGYVDLAVVLTARPHTEVVKGQNVRTIVRAMQTFPDSRMPWVKDRSGRMPMEFPINFEDDYERLHALIFGGAKAASTQETVLPPETEEDVVAEAEKVVADAEPAEPKKKAGRPKKTEAASKANEKASTTTETTTVVEPEVEPPAPAEVVEPEPDTSVPDPEPEAESEPEPQVDETVEESKVEKVVDVRDDAAPAKESVPSSETDKDDLICTDCDGEIHSKDQAELSHIRFRRKLCRGCMTKARAKK